MIKGFHYFVLLGMLAAAACSPAQTPAPTAVIPTPTATVAAIATSSESPTPNLPTATAMASPLPEATSRGPNLEATDPGSVELASGSLQLVEFFRFT